MFQTFGEYLDRTGKLQEKPKVSKDGDTGPTNKGDKPPQAAKSGKNWKAEAAQVKDETKPYKATGKDPGQPAYEKGLVNKGDEKLVYKPKVDDQKLKTNITKTEEFINKTKNLTSEEYAKAMLDKKNGPTITKIIETANVIKNNEDLIETLVREIKRNDDFSKLIEVILDHPETYKELAIQLANESKGKIISRQLAKSLNEITAPPETEDMEEEEEPKKTKTVKGTPVKDNNIMASKKQYIKPEHSLIEALANYRNIRTTMIKILT